MSLNLMMQQYVEMYNSEREKPPLKIKKHKKIWEKKRMEKIKRFTILVLL